MLHAGQKEVSMPGTKDGPASPLFAAVSLKGNIRIEDLAGESISREMKDKLPHAPTGRLTCWGIPFRIGKVLLVRDKAVTAKIGRLKARWLVFMHTCDRRPYEQWRGGIVSPYRGYSHLGEHEADYVVVYADGTELRLPIVSRRQIGPYWHPWGENCFEAVGYKEPYPLCDDARDKHETRAWGHVQFRTLAADLEPWMNWLWAWENPAPTKPIVALRFEPGENPVIISTISAGNVDETPIRWSTRRKAVLKLPKGEKFDPARDEFGRLRQVQLDMGQVISAKLRPVYPERGWAGTYHNQVPPVSDRELLIEYTAHPQARFHLPGGKTIPVAKLENADEAGPLRVVPPATQRVSIRVLEKGSRKPVPVKLHLHGVAGEYLAPVDRHRIPNPFWFQDYSVDFTHQGVHHCTYIPGETAVNLPVGKVYVEISKGFEIRPIRQVVRVSRATKELVFEIEKVLPWREQGWVTADTHVHFLSPHSALLEGAGEGVNVVNLLASQWGELMTNVGDFDGKTTLGAKECGGDGEYMVRVGTENRQHVMGHISLLGYNGNIIAPMTTGGPDESALGDAIQCLLTEWAQQCHKQDGVVILPHFPNPRAEHAATVVSGNVDGVEMTSWGDHYHGIDPYSLSDWYRYLNCGYMTAAVGGTDKMAANTAVGTVRTYARLRPDEGFTYDAWKNAVRRGETFVTYGPLLDFAVEGKPAGTKIRMTASGGTVDVAWQLASVTVPMSRVELVVNGEIRESQAVRPDSASGSWSVKLGRSSWLALLVRGQYPGKAEMIAAHSSPVMVEVAGTPFMAAADAVTILEQIEGALAYLDVVGTRAETAAYKRMRLVLTAAHRSLHNRMHAAGEYHKHTPAGDHGEHHG
jgi:hypothetical protein